MSPSRQFVILGREGRPVDRGGTDLASGKHMNSPLRILFVEDDPEMSAIYAENFLPPEFEAETAENGQKALDKLHDSHFDVVVTDNFMPEMDGLTLLRWIKEHHPELKVLLVTAYGDWTSHAKASQLGASKFIDKPVRMTQLKETIRELFAGSAA